METILIETKQSGNAKFIMELVKKLGEKGEILNKNEREDFLLGEIIKSQKTGKNVSREDVFKNLRR